MCEHKDFHVTAHISRHVDEGDKASFRMRAVATCSGCGKSFIPKAAGIIGELELIPVDQAAAIGEESAA